MASLEVKANEQPAKFEPLKAKADQIDKLAHDFDAYLEDLKSKMTAKIDDPTDYEIMDKGDYLDEHFFKGDKIKEDGQAFLGHMKTFREGVTNVLAGEKGMEPVIKEVNDKFSTEEVKNRDGHKVDWLDYHYKGTLSSEVSMNNYTTILTSRKSAYFNGETYDGEIVLGRRDESTKPNRVELTLDGRKLVEEKDFTIEGGKVKLNVNSGSPGEHKLEGKLIFSQDGEEIEVPVERSFATIPKPNAATISADKMNVVYRGVKNPMTISFAGIADNNVSASAQGLSRAGGSKYIMDATTIKGREVTINVTGKIDGQSVSDNATFRIKDLPKPTGTIRGEDGAIKMQRNSKVPGQPTIEVKGSKLDARAKGALRKAKRGSDVTIFDIEARASGVSVILKKVSPIIIELTN